MRDTLTTSLVSKIQHRTPHGSAAIEEYRFVSYLLYIKFQTTLSLKYVTAAAYVIKSEFQNCPGLLEEYIYPLPTNKSSGNSDSIGNSDSKKNQSSQSPRIKVPKPLRIGVEGAPNQLHKTANPSSSPLICG